MGEHAAMDEDGAARLGRLLAEARDLSSASEELTRAAWDLPSRLALDASRANALRALDLRPGLRAAEIGAGAGAIARFLGERCASVLALEADPALAAPARLRCRGLENVEVAETDSLSLLAARGPFDLIVLADASAALLGRLGEAAAALAPGGAAVVAAPNRLAISAYAAPPDPGVEGDASRGTTRAELLAALRAAGFASAQLFLPFPDHRFPVAVLSADYADAEDAERWNLAEWARHPFAAERGERARLLHDHLALEAAARAGLLADHAQAFVAAAWAAPGAAPAVRRASWIARKYGFHRKRAYRAETTLTEAGLVRRLLEPEAAPEDAPALRRAPSAPHLPASRSLSWEMVRALRPAFDADRFRAALGRWIGFLRDAAAGGDALPGRFLDCTPDKLRADAEGTLVFADDEWESPEAVPLDWVLFRGLLGFWLAERPWIEAALLREPYRFRDYLDACLAPQGAAIPEERLPALAELERRFQEAVLAAPGVDYAHLLTNVYAPELARALRPSEVRSQAAEEGTLRRARAEAEEARRKAEESYALACAENDFLRAVRAEAEGARDRSRVEGASVRSLESSLRLEIARREAAERERAAAEEKRRRVRERIDRRIAERLRAVREGLLKDRPGSEPPPAARRTYDVLIPIYNAYDHVKRCVESVLRHTEPRHAVYLLDDASPDPRILPLLEDFAKRDARVRVVPSERNGGFVRNVNRGFALSRRPAVILNSDTEVTPFWLDRLDRCRESAPGVGVVSPLSNNATVLSVPEMNADNKLPEGMTPEDFAALVARVSARAYPRLPTAVGFCMLITRAVLDRCGGFDEVFGLGYGEECDLCMKAWAAGFEVVCCDDAYVHHYGEASFKSVDKIDERRLRNARTLDRRWPSYHPTVFAFCRMNPMREIQERIRTALDRREGEARPHVLHVMHSWGALGGTELHTAQMIDGAAGEVRATVVYPHAQPDLWTDMVSGRPAEHLRVVRFSKENAASVESFLGVAGDLANGTTEGNFARLVGGGDYEVVHFQHLAAWASLTLPFVAKELGRRVVLSLHDYFLLCPDYNLVTPDARRCGKARADENDEGCFRCLGEKRASLEKKAPIPLHEYLEDRTETVRRILELADALIAPSEFVHAQFERAYGAEIGRKIRVIPHGLPALSPSPRPKRGGFLRAGFLGNLTDRKGGAVLMEAARRLQGKPVRLEVFGGVQPALHAAALKAGLKLRGPYAPKDLPELLSKMDLVVIPSVWDETFCLTLGEAQAMGVPVLATDAGAMSERIEDGRTGFLVPPGDAAALAERLARLARERDAVDAVAENLRGLRRKTLEENAADYARLYAELAGRSDGGARLLRAFLGFGERKAA